MSNLYQVLSDGMPVKKAIKALLKAGEGHYIAPAFAQDRTSDILTLTAQGARLLPSCFESMEDWVQTTIDRGYNRAGRYTDIPFILLRGKPVPVFKIASDREKLLGYGSLSKLRLYILRDRLINKHIPCDRWLKEYSDKYACNVMPEYLREELILKELASA